MVVGAINASVLEKLLNDFMAPERRNDAVDIILLGEDKPTKATQELVKEYWNTSFCVGSPMDPKRIKQLLGYGCSCRPHDALVCISNLESGDQKEADEQVELVVCAAKNTFPDLNIIAVVHLPQSKVAIEDIDGWRLCDVVVSVDEFTQNLIAQNCVAPGAASIITSLIEINAAEIIT